MSTSTAQKSKSLRGYLKLVREYPLRPIENDRELDRAIAMVNDLLDRPRLTKDESDYLDVLGDLIHKYEHEAHPIPKLPRHIFLRELLKDRGIKQRVLARGAGISEQTISEILAGKRRISLSHIPKLAAFFKLPMELFIDQQYQS